MNDLNAVMHPTFKIHVLTLFPELFPGPLGVSVTGRALEKQRWQMNVINIRDFAKDTYKTVDDVPFGGGAGMVMKADILHDALMSLGPVDRVENPLIYLSPRGKTLTQDMAKDLSTKKGMTLVCGRYEGVDQRFLDHHQVQEISIGDFVLTGGELAAYVLLDACIRLLPGVVGNQETLSQESFDDFLLEYPHYTRPAEWMGLQVPEVLRSGHHKEIEKYRRSQAEEITRARRPDLWQKYAELKKK